MIFRCSSARIKNAKKYGSLKIKNTAIPAQTKKIAARIINKKEVPETTRGPAGGLRETAPIFSASEFTETGAKSTGKAATERSFFLRSANQIRQIE